MLLFFPTTYLCKARFPLYTFILNWLNAVFDKKFQFYPSKKDKEVLKMQIKLLSLILPFGIYLC